MVKIEDLKVGDILVGKYTGQEYKIVYISENNNIFAEYDVSNEVVPTVIRRNRLNNYTLKPRQTKVYIVIWKDKNNTIQSDKVYNHTFLNDIKNNCDVLDVLEYYEDI